MVYAQVSDKYIHFLLIYMTDHIFPVLPIKYLVNRYGKPTNPHKMSTFTKSSISNLHYLFCPCVVQNSTAHVDTKALNMCHQPKTCFRGIFVGIPQHQKVFLVYVPSTQKIVSSDDVLSDETFSSALAYMPLPYFEALSMRPAVSYIPYTTSSHEQTGDIITFSQFEEGDLV